MSKKRLILHCGLPKAGSTALQQWFFRERPRLRARGIVYPGPHLMEREPKQGFLVPAMRRAGSRGLETLRKRLSKIKHDTVVLSHEGLTNHLYDLDPDATATFREITAEWTVTVLLIVRDPTRWLHSYHAQCVINPPNAASVLWGTALDPAGIAQFPSVQAMMDHDRLATDLKRTFGADQVIQIDMDTPDWFGKVIETVGVPDLVDRALPETNARLPAWAVQVLRQANSFSDDPGQWRAWRQALQAELQTDSVQMTLAADEAPERIDPLHAQALRPDPKWKPTDREAFDRFAATLPGLPEPTTSGDQIPRILWMLWLQGWADPPRVVQAARASWARHHPDWDIRFLDETTLSNYIPQDVLERIFALSSRRVVNADFIRMELLQRHGGVWADATLLCTMPLGNWLPRVAQSGFFAFDRPNSDRPLANWFLAGAPDNLILRRWLDQMYQYWKGRDDFDHYFWMHETFDRLCQNDPEAKALWDQTPKLCARQSLHFGPESVRLQAPPPPWLPQLLERPHTPVIKLSHRLEDAPGPDTLFSALCDYGLG